MEVSTPESKVKHDVNIQTDDVIPTKLSGSLGR